MTDIVRGEKAADNSILAVTLNNEYTVLDSNRHNCLFAKDLILNQLQLETCLFFRNNFVTDLRNLRQRATPRY